MKVGVFIPCCVDQFSASTAFNLISILQKIGLDVYYPKKQTCCGRIAANEGDEAFSKNLAESFLDDFADYDCIVGCSSSCTTYVRANYPKLVNNPGISMYVKRIYDLTEFLVNVMNIVDLDSYFPYKVLYLDDVRSYNDCGLYSESRALLQNVKGLDLVQTSGGDFDFSFDESFASNFEPIQSEMARMKLQSALEAGAEYITSTDFATLLYLQSYINKNKSKYPISCKHIVDILASHE